MVLPPREGGMEQGGDQVGFFHMKSLLMMRRDLGW